MIGLLGINHKTANLEVREKYSLNQSEILCFADWLQSETNISHCVILSTCNRTEIYFFSDSSDYHSSYETVYKLLNVFKKIDGHYWHNFYHKANLEVVDHLFQVASGLDSLVLGEDQIIGQIKEAYLFCTNAALTNDVLMRMFQKSFEAGKRVRTETAIKQGTTSISSASVELCVKHLGDVYDKSLLMIGAGETSELVLQNFSNKDIGRISIANRTIENAERLAKVYNAEVIQFEDFETKIEDYDIIAIATNAPDYLIKYDTVQTVKNSKKQVFIDLSVPRNIDERISHLEEKTLICIDDLTTEIQITNERKQEAAHQAKLIITEVVTEFAEWLASRSLRPTIKKITNTIQQLQKRELEMASKEDNVVVKEKLEEAVNSLSQRYTGLLIKNLKSITDNGKNLDRLNLIDELFKID